MAINKNHECEELDGVKCAIVEKNVSQERVDFLKQLLEFNNYTVMVQASPPPKAAPAPAPAADANAELAPAPAPPPTPTTFTIGVTNLIFNTTNAVFGRLLKAPGGHVVTLAYWRQEDKAANDMIPYYEHK